MKTYFKDKLRDNFNHILTNQSKLLDACNELNIRDIEAFTKSIHFLQKQRKDLLIDACKYLSVEDVVELMTTGAENYFDGNKCLYINKKDYYEIRYYFEYVKFTTAQEASMLKKASDGYLSNFKIKC